MPKHPSPTATTGWLRAEIPIEIHLKFHYVRDRFGMYNLPEAIRYVLSYLLFSYDAEKLCQDMAADLKVELPEIDLETEAQKGTLTNE